MSTRISMAVWRDITSDSGTWANVTYRLSEPVERQRHTINQQWNTIQIMPQDWHAFSHFSISALLESFRRLLHVHSQPPYFFPSVSASRRAHLTKQHPSFLSCCALLLQNQDPFSKMTETETRNHHADKQQNGGAMAETSTVEDVFDDTYKMKEGPKPPRMLVWRNIILMSLLHLGALYGLTLVPSASVPTLAFSKYLLYCSRLSCAAFFFFLSL